MFTGIITGTGIVKGARNAGSGRRLEIKPLKLFNEAPIGGSVSLNGVCLTLVENADGILKFDVMEETIKRSALAHLRTGDSVNIEPSLKALGSIGGHFVLGHVDCVGRVTSAGRRGGEFSMEIEYPERFAGLIVEKGSIAVDGVSLTIGNISDKRFRVYVIPHTLNTTNLASRRAGDEVNIEFDLIGKYLARFGELGPGGVTEKFLRENGF